jgi:hypothetical protein
MFRPVAWLLLTVIALSGAPASALDLRVAGSQLILGGAVEKGDYARVKAALDENAGVDTIILRNSPGGDAQTGYALGDLFRERKLRTAVAGYCRSSCSRLFLGGVSRHVTDEQPPGKTYVAFHGNYKNDGRLNLDMVYVLRNWIIAHSDGKADVALVERWTAIPNRNGFVYFFDPTRLRRKDGVSAFYCSGAESREHRFDECEKIAGKTGYDLGIFTTREIVTVYR